MTITWTQFAWIAGVFLSWNSALVGVIWLLIRYSIKQFKVSLVKEFGGLKTDMDDLKKQIEVDRSDWRRTDTEVKNLLIRLPIDYQRREDSIREYTVMNAKLDRIYENSLEGKRH